MGIMEFWNIRMMSLGEDFLNQCLLLRTQNSIIASFHHFAQCVIE